MPTNVHKDVVVRSPTACIGVVVKIKSQKEVTEHILSLTPYSPDIEIYAYCYFKSRHCPSFLFQLVSITGKNIWLVHIRLFVTQI